jgi:hypothetical protein
MLYRCSLTLREKLHQSVACLTRQCSSKISHNGSQGIIEVREYTLKPEGMADFLKLAANTAPVRKQLLPFLGYVQPCDLSCCCRSSPSFNRGPVALPPEVAVEGTELLWRTSSGWFILTDDPIWSKQDVHNGPWRGYASCDPLLCIQGERASSSCTASRLL